MLAIALREDFDATELRRVAKLCKDATQSRRLLALVVIYDGGTPTDAARMGGVNLQVFHDWVLLFNAEGAAGLIDRKGKSLKFNDSQLQALIDIVWSGRSQQSMA